MRVIDTAKYRATSGNCQGFGATPQEAVSALLSHTGGQRLAPIVIWPFNQGDSFFSDAQHDRMEDLRSRLSWLTEAERCELDQSIDDDIEATIARTQSISFVKS